MLATRFHAVETISTKKSGLDHGVGHPVLIDLPHDSLWWTEGRRRYLDSFQDSGKHRAWLLSEKPGVSHLLHTKWPSHLRAFLDKLGTIEGEVLACLIDLHRVLPGD